MNEHPTTAPDTTVAGAEAETRGSRGAPLAVSAGLLVVGAVLLWQSLIINADLGDAAGPKLMPVAVSVIWLLLSVAYLVQHLRHYVRGEVGDDVDRFDSIGQVVLIVVILIGYAYALQPVGYLISTTLLVLLTAYVFGSRSWRRDLIVAVVMSAIVYFTFSRSLGIYLPPGVLPL